MNNFNWLLSSANKNYHLIIFVKDSKDIFNFILKIKGGCFDFLNDINLYFTNLLIMMVIML